MILVFEFTEQDRIDAMRECCDWLLGLLKKAEARAEARKPEVA